MPGNEMQRLEELYPDGLTSHQIVVFFQERGFRMSEATLRKYVQLGILPRSRRVGRKGKHKGSQGIYPHRVLERIYSIKALMDDGYTMDEIKRTLMRFRGRIDDVENTLNELFTEFQRELAQPRFDLSARQDTEKEIDEARRTAQDLMERLECLERRFSEAIPAASELKQESLPEMKGHKYF